MGKGRKRKPGKRTPSGQLSRAKVDKGNLKTAEKADLYRGNGTDPIGRAYERGLLGTGADAKTMLDTARAINRAYWAAYQNGPIRCTLADRVSGAGIPNDIEREAAQERWLDRMLSLARHNRPLFDDLVININPDEGPAWLDRILHKHASHHDLNRLESSLETLAACAGVLRKALAIAA